MSTDDPREDLAASAADCRTNHHEIETESVPANSKTDDYDSSACHSSAHTPATVSFGDEPGDVIMNTGDKLFCCHKAVLTEHSLYFQAMFESGMKESQSGHIHLEEISSEHFHSLLDYFYTGELDLSESNVQGMTEVSSHFQVSHVLNHCCELLLSMIEDDLCLSLMRLANFLTLPDVYNHSRRHALWYFHKVCHTEDFVQAPSAQIIDYLQDPHLNIESEVDVFNAAAQWLGGQREACDVTDFLGRTVNFHLMVGEEIAGLKDLPTVLTNENQKVKAFVASLDQKDVLTMLLTKDPSRRRMSPANSRILCMGAHQCALSGCRADCPFMLRQTAPLEVLAFQPEGCYLEPLASLSEHYPTLALDSGYRVCAIGAMVYVVGGEAQMGRTGGWLTTMWCLDTLRCTWHEAGTLQTVRRHHGMCAYGSTLFLIGGIGRYRIRLQSVESFNTHTGAWQQLPAMLYHETSPAVTQHKGSIYVFKNYAQIFCIATSSWTYMELYPPVPGLPIYAHPSPDTNGIFVSCFNSESLWLVDLDRQQSQKVADFAKEGGGGALCKKHFYHFQLQESGTAGGTQVEHYSVAEASRGVVGVLAGAVLTSQFVTVPGFPCYTPSSSSPLC